MRAATPMFDSSAPQCAPHAVMQQSECVRWQDEFESLVFVDVSR
jgi:hypothetical protein